LQGGAGRYPDTPSPASASSAANFLQRRAGFDDSEVEATLGRSVSATVKSLTSLQGCKLWDVPSNLTETELSKSQKELVGKGYAGPPVDLEGVSLLPEQKLLCLGGMGEEQLKRLKAQVLYHLPAFHEIIDRAVLVQRERQLAKDPNTASPRVTSTSSRGVRVVRRSSEPGVNRCASVATAGLSGSPATRHPSSPLSTTRPHAVDAQSCLNPASSSALKAFMPASAAAASAALTAPFVNAAAEPPPRDADDDVPPPPPPPKQTRRKSKGVVVGAGQPLSSHDNGTPSPTSSLKSRGPPSTQGNRGSTLGLSESPRSLRAPHSVDDPRGRATPTARRSFSEAHQSGWLERHVVATASLEVMGGERELPAGAMQTTTAFVGWGGGTVDGSR